LEYDALARQALASGAEAGELFNIPALERIGRAKTAPEENWKDEYKSLYEAIKRELFAKGGAGND
jgi:V/A-type H+-transporting ATPase subunit A